MPSSFLVHSSHRPNYFQLTCIWQYLVSLSFFSSLLHGIYEKECYLKAANRKQIYDKVASRYFGKRSVGYAVQYYSTYFLNTEDESDDLNSIMKNIYGII